MFHRTQRLFLRPGWGEDVPAITRAIAHESVVRMLARVPWPYGEADARWWVEQDKPATLPSLLITLPEDRGAVIGTVGLHEHEHEGQAEVGYWITPDRWGRGYASEALGGLLQIARTLGHRRLAGRHAADNPASGRVLRKAGFVPTGRIGTFASRGRGATVPSPEYVVDLAQGDESGPAGGDEDYRVAA